MPNLVSNPLFQVIVLFIVTTGIWFLVTNETSEYKKKILSFVTDALYYFVLTTFGLNILFNFREIIIEPYRTLLFSSEISWMASILMMIFLVIRESKKITLSNKVRDQLIDHTLNYFLLLALFNHLFYYYKYRSINSVIFILVYFLFYLFKDRINYPRKNEFILLALAFIHALVMYSFNKIVIYYQIVFYPYQIISLLFIASILLYYFRRESSSKQK